jgi:endonuclease/exonuclease/phosphatase (EEP) superfamily protein YafD
MQRYTKRIVRFLGFALLACSLTLVSPMGIWPFELLQALALQVAMVGMLILILCIATRQWMSAVSSLAATTLICWHLHPYQPFIHEATEAERNLTVGVFNVYHHNENYTEGIATMLGQDCDVMAFLEVSPAWDFALTGALEHVYPYSIRVPQNSCCYGMSLYSRLPMVADTVLHFTRDPVIKVAVSLDGNDVEVWSVHTRPPIFPNDTEERNFLLNQVASEIAASIRPSLLIGDLNIVPWAKEFKQLKAVSGMDDSRRGFLATYPMDLRIPLIPIDHILHTEAFYTTFCRTVEIPGSDHKGLVAGLKWR